MSLFGPLLCHNVLPSRYKMCMHAYIVSAISFILSRCVALSYIKFIPLENIFAEL